MVCLFIKEIAIIYEGNFIYFLKYFKIFYVFVFREGEREEERGREKHQCVAASCVPPTWGWVCNPHMCPDWESNQRPFALQSSTQSTEQHQPGLNTFFYCCSSTVVSIFSPPLPPAPPSILPPFGFVHVSFIHVP